MTAPLRLNSKRWTTLYAHFDDPTVPSLIARWRDVAGRYGEEFAYAPIREAYLHQGTLAEIAYAVVPHLVARIDELHPDRQQDLLDDLADVESVRRMTPADVETSLARAAKKLKGLGPEMSTMMLASLRARLAPLPADLSPSYLAAMKKLEQLAGRGWRKRKRNDRVTHPRFWRRHVEYLRAAGWTNDDIAFGMRALRGEVPGVRDYDPFTPGDALAMLRTIKKKLAPAGWFERTLIATPGGELPVEGLSVLASWRMIDPAKILR